MDDNIVPIVFFICGALTAIGIPLARAFARRMDRMPSAPAVPPELAAQIERMEHAIDSIAIEVERISEGQRFTTRLLADRAGAESVVPSSSTGPRS